MTSVHSAYPLGRRKPSAFVAGVLATLLATVTLPASAATFNVDTNSDGSQDPSNTSACVEVNASNQPTGHCSLRAAIMVGNGITGPHTINLNSDVLIANGGFPHMRAPYTLNGNNHTIDGGGLSCLGLDDSGTSQASPSIQNGNGATGSTIQGIAIGHCGGDAISANGHGYTFKNNFIGVDTTGTPGIFSNSKQNTGNGISLSASFAYDSQFIDVAGLQALNNALPVQPVTSSDISSFSVNLATALQNLNPNTITGNVISNNALHGINIFSENLAATIITLNFIGTDATGNVAAPNGGNGIELSGSTFGNLIGPGNTISGNAQHGIGVEAGAVFLPNFIMGNRIGLATAAGNHVGNGASGIYIDTQPDTSVAHFNPSMIGLIVGPLNVIADNQGANNNAFPDVLGSSNAGITITGNSTKIKVVGNRIGIAEFPSGTPLNSAAYGNKGDGIYVTTSGNTIGAGGAGGGNVIAANARHGIVVSGGATTGNSFVGNSIGVDTAFAGNLGLGNGVDGLHIDSASATTVGGTGASDFNTVAGNGRNGIKIVNGGSSSNDGWANLLQRNLIYRNAITTAGVGIDLDRAQNAGNPLISGPSEIPANYTNLDQAQPVICLGTESSGSCGDSTAPASSGGNTTLQWTLATHGPASFRVEFFRIDAADDNSATTMSFLAEQSITTDASANLIGSGTTTCTPTRCTSTFAGAAGGAWIVMTVTDVTALTNTPGGGSDWKATLKCFAGDLGNGVWGILPACTANNTSEFSNAASVPTPTPIVSAQAATNVTANGATLNGTVNDNGAAVTAIEFDYSIDASYGSHVAATPSTLASGTGATAVSATLSGLACNTTYHFRVDATGIGGTATDTNNLTFTTQACPVTPPSATTAAASAISDTAATLNGTVNDDGATTSVSFDYGTTTGYGTTVAATPGSVAAGSGSTAVSAALTGLSCGTTYHFRVEATNAGGTTLGADQSFVTAACATAPTVTTAAASSVGATTATLNGIVSANGATTGVDFVYGTTTAYGLSVNANAPNPLPANASDATVTANISGLACGTTYHFRVEAFNGVGGTATLGSDMTFATSACPAPTATTGAATNVTTSSITFNGSVDANGNDATVFFDYGPTASYGSVIAATPGTVLANAGASAVSATVAAACGTTVHFRVRATNAINTTNGSDQSATLGACGATPPTVQILTIDPVTATTATINGSVNANGYTTSASVEYGTTTGYGQTAAAVPSLLSGSTNTPVSANLSGLSCGTTYHVRLDANNLGGSVNTADSQFTTLACSGQSPDATTGLASGVTATSATLNASVTANGAQTAVSFDYGTTIGYGSNAVATQSPLPANANNAAASVIVSGLNCGTLYHFRVKADNGNNGPVYGVDQTFTTSACAAGTPTATSLVATAVGATSATLNGSVNANGAATTVSFAYGPDANYGSTIAATPSSLPANAVGTAVTAALGGLTCGTTYHFRVDATNANGSGHGGDLNFTTAACPVVTTFTGPTATGTGNGHAVLSGGGSTCTLVNPAFVAAPVSPPAGVSFPDGLFQFHATGCTGTITLTVTFPSPFAANVQYWKYGPTSSQNSDHWYTLGATNNLSLLANVATFTISDGGFGDDDLSVNGTIIDAGGPSFTTAVTPQATVTAPMLDPRHLAALISLIALFGTAAMRMRRKTNR